MSITLRMTKGQTQTISFSVSQHIADNFEPFILFGKYVAGAYGKMREFKDIVPKNISPMTIITQPVYDQNVDPNIPQTVNVTILIDGKDQTFPLNRESWIAFDSDESSITAVMRDKSWIKTGASPADLINWLYPDPHHFSDDFDTDRHVIKVGRLEFQYDRDKDELPLWNINLATWRDVAMFAAERIRLVGRGIYFGLGPISDAERMLADMAGEK